MSLCSTSYQPYSDGDAFLPLFFIVCIVFAVAANLTLLATVSTDNTLDQNGYLRVMCFINLASGLTIIPTVLVMSVWSDVMMNNVFCSISGVLTNFLHGASMLNICAINFERYQAVAYPMKYRYSKRSKAPKFISAYVILVPLFLSITPFFFLTIPYGPLSHAPMCVTLPKTAALTVIGYIDVAFTFAVPWTIMMATSVGLLKISFKLSHAVVHPIQVAPANVRVNENVCVKGENKFVANRASRSSTKDGSRQYRNIFTRPNNAKAMITVATTFCIFSVLNGPSAAFVIAIRSSFTCPSSQSSDHPALEYLFCVTSIASYVVYPLLNGLTSRDVRLKMLQMVRNRLSVKIIDVNELEGSTTTNRKDRNSIKRLAAERDLTTGLKIQRKSLTGLEKLSSKSRTITILTTQSTEEYHVNPRITSAPQRRSRLLIKETEYCQPYKLRQIPAALMPHSVSCPITRKKFLLADGYKSHTKNMNRKSDDARCTRRSAINTHRNTLPLPILHQIHS